MKTKTHTPGPWYLLHHTAAQHDGDRAVYGPGDKWICDMNGGQNDDDGTLANARLIASCPIMYDYVLSKSKEGDKNAKEIINSIDGRIA